MTSTATNYLDVYSVEEYDAGNGKKARSWTRVGAAFPHKDGTGFNIELRALPLDGKLVVLPADREQSSDDTRDKPRR